MNRIERNGYAYPAWMDSDSHVIELFRKAKRKRSVMWQVIGEELKWWAKCSAVVGCTILAGLLVGWGLSKVIE